MVYGCRRMDCKSGQNRFSQRPFWVQYLILIRPLPLFSQTGRGFKRRLRVGKSYSEKAILKQIKRPHRGHAPDHGKTLPPTRKPARLRKPVPRSPIARSKTLHGLRSVRHVVVSGMHPRGVRSMARMAACWRRIGAKIGAVAITTLLVIPAAIAQEWWGLLPRRHP